ncbi:group II intron reverse transcriptase/maturase [Sorangium cellulosum]|uniref:group II intron reverse transcriptase/maturase n=1 Tax=Sorangium cellulosum TaxID=56 RepID=UPI00191BDEC7|nr:group II intron reverse transcriptase/maturase [Sorangium cellulosum]
MARQKSEDRMVPKSRRKAAVTRRGDLLGGGKAVPVNERTGQLGMRFGTAEDLPARAGRADGVADMGRPVAATRAVPKPRRKKKTATSATMEEVTERLREAFEKVASNNGAPGPDRQSIEQVREHLPRLLPELSAALLAGTYVPGDIRRVWLPKPGGGERGLGIPNVVDRVVQEAVRQVLEPLYEPTFHESSHGFRPGRSCHTAIAQARGYVEEGYEWVVDLDLEKFFDRVHHQRLMARLAQRVTDRRLLVVIGRMLKARVVMPDGVAVSTDEGVPQGGPLSPLLSNIVLDELDQELARRGHRFVRYADDCNIYVGSEQAGRRVMASVVSFIERRLRLKVNAAKSAVARPEERHFVGFRLRREPLDGEVEVLLSKRSKERVDAAIRELTPRNWGGSLRACILQLNAFLLGWLGFFGICTAGIKQTLEGLDAHARRRLRAIQLAHWKTKRTIVGKLIRLGVKPRTAWRNVYGGRKSRWALSHSPVVDRGLRNAYFAERGLVSLTEQWEVHARRTVAPVQLMLPLG